MQANFDLISELRGSQRMADYFVETLALAGCLHVFGMPAESLNPVLDAMRKHGGIRFISVRHEANGALMASASAKLTGRPGACMGTAGPGATHLPVGAYDARGDGAPLVLLTGQVWGRLLGAGGFQEIDSVRLLEDGAHTSRLIGSVQETEGLTLAIARAVHFRTAVHVAIPSDVASSRLPRASRPRLRAGWLTPQVATVAQSLERAAELLTRGGPGVILVGDVGIDVQPQVELLAGRMRAPILLIPEAIQYERRPSRELTVRVAAGALADLNEIVRRSERIVVVGRASAAIAGLLKASSAPVLHLAPRLELDVSGSRSWLRIIGNLEASLTALARVAVPGDDGIYRELQRRSDSASADREFWQGLDRALPPDATIALEPGRILEGAFRDFAVRERRVTSSFQLGARGYALLGSIAGALTRPEARAIGVASEAGLRESMADLVTARKCDLPIVLVCKKDARSSEEPPIDFCAFAASAGYSVRSVAAHEPLESAFQFALQERRPTLIAIAANQKAREQRVPEVTVASKTLCSLLIDALVSARVTRLFVHVQPSIEAFVAQVRGDGRIVVTPVAYAESAAMMASAHAKWTRTLGVVIAAEAPELLAQLNGLYDAAFDRAPVLILTSCNTPLVDPFKLLGEVAAVSHRLSVENAIAELREVLSEAYRQRAVTHLAVDWNSLSSPAAGLPPWFALNSEPEPMIADEAAMREALAVLGTAKRPVLLVGRGAAEACDEVSALAEQLHAPIVSTMPGRGVVPDDHPHYVGAIGASGHRSAIEALGSCDVLLSVGSSSRGAVYGFVGRFTLIEIDRDALQIGRRPFPTIGLCGDAAPTLRALEKGLKSATHVRQHQPNGVYGRKLRQSFERFCRRNRELEHSNSLPIRPPAICVVLNKVLQEKNQQAVITVDVGVTTLWVYRHLIGGNHKIVWTSSFATMGFAMPAALAICEQDRTRPVVAIAGDGGIAVTMAELASAVIRRVPIVVIIFNNGKLAAIKYEQEVMGWPEFESTLDNPDFAQYARSCGARGIRVTEPAALESALREALTCGEPCVVDVLCDPNDLPAPPKVHLRQAAGYLLAVSREGPSGLRELARQAGKIVRFEQ